MRTAQSPHPPNKAPAADPHPTLSPPVCTLLLPSASKLSHYAKLLTLSCPEIAELNIPLKKRRAKYIAEMTPAPSDHLLRPLSPITPPIPEDPLHLPLPNPCGALLPNGLTYSPMPSLSASRCNTPLQFEVRKPLLPHNRIAMSHIEYVCAEPLNST